MAQLRNNEYYLKKLYRAAEVQDVNKDGKVTRADYDLMVSKYDAMDMPQEYKQELADAIYSTSDSLGLTDHTKSLTYDEIVNSWIDNVEKICEYSFDKIFRIIDTDKSGTISLKEWEMRYVAMGIPVEHARPSFEAMDTNKDGTISREEFVVYTSEYFHTSEDTLHSSLLFSMDHSIKLMDLTTTESRQ